MDLNKLKVLKYLLEKGFFPITITKLRLDNRRNTLHYCYDVLLDEKYHEDFSAFIDNGNKPIPCWIHCLKQANKNKKIKLRIREFIEDEENRNENEVLKYFTEVKYKKIINETQKAFPDATPAVVANAIIEVMIGGANKILENEPDMNIEIKKIINLVNEF